MWKLIAPYLPDILTLLATALTGYLILLAKRVLKKYGIELSDAQEAKLKYYAQKAAAFVEEYAARKLKLDGVKLSADERESLALEKVREWLNQPPPDKRVPNEVITDTVTAVLPTLGMGAAANAVPKAPGTSGL